MTTLIFIAVALLTIALAVCHLRLNKLRAQLAEAYSSADRQREEAKKRSSSPGVSQRDDSD